MQVLNEGGDASPDRCSLFSKVAMAPLGFDCFGGVHLKVQLYKSIRLHQLPRFSRPRDAATLDTARRSQFRLFNEEGETVYHRCSLFRDREYLLGSWSFLG